MSPGWRWTAARTACIFTRLSYRKALHIWNEGGWLCFEIGYDQGAAVQQLMDEGICNCFSDKGSGRP